MAQFEIEIFYPNFAILSHTVSYCLPVVEQHPQVKRISRNETSRDQTNESERTDFFLVHLHQNSIENFKK